jgi:hypothetical protein
MKKMPFYTIFILILCILAVPTYALLRYSNFDGIGVGNLEIAAIVVSILPALLISIWRWNVQDDD